MNINVQPNTSTLPPCQSKVVCGITNCHGIFENIGRFIEHMIDGQHSPCDPCKKMTNKWFGENYSPYYMCACNKGFKTKNECEQHIKDSHAVKLFWPLHIVAYGCPTCLLIFDKEELCQLHMELEDHYSFTFSFKDDVVSSKTSKEDLKKIKPIGIPVDLCNVYLRNCSKVPWRLECYSCNVVLEYPSDIQYHPVGTDHRLTSYAHKLPVEVFADFMCSHACQYCLKVFDLPKGQEIEYHSCVENVVGKVERNNCKTLQEFVLRKSLTVSDDFCGLPTSNMSLTKPGPSSNFFNAKGRNSNCPVTQKTSSNNQNNAKEIAVSGKQACNTATKTRNVASIEDFIRSVRKASANFFASGDCVKKSYDLRNNLIAKSRWQAPYWQTTKPPSPEQTSSGSCSRVLPVMHQEEPNTSPQDQCAKTKKGRCRKRNRRSEKDRRRRKRQFARLALAKETNTGSDSSEDPESKHQEVGKGCKAESRGYWTPWNPVNQYSGGNWTDKKENAESATSKVKGIPQTIPQVGKEGKWEDLQNGLDFLLIDRTGNRDINAKDGCTRKSNSKTFHDSLKINFQLQMKDANANNSNRNSDNKKKEKDGNPSCSTKITKEELLKNALKSARKERNKKTLRYFHNVKENTEKQFKEDNCSRMKHNYESLVKINFDSDPEVEFPSHSTIPKYKDELNNMFDMTSQCRKKKIESFIMEEMDKNLNNESFAKKDKMEKNLTSESFVKNDKMDTNLNSGSFDNSDRMDKILNSESFVKRNKKYMEGNCSCFKDQMNFEQQTSPIENSASPTVKENQLKRKSESTGREEDVKRLKMNDDGVCIADKEKDDCPEVQEIRENGGEQAKNSPLEDNFEVQLMDNIDFWENEVAAKQRCPGLRVTLPGEKSNKIEIINLTDTPKKSLTDTNVIDLTETPPPTILIDDSLSETEMESPTKQDESNNLLIIEPLSRGSCQPSTSRYVPQIVQNNQREERVLEYSDDTASLLKHRFGRCIELSSAKQIIFLDLDNWHSFFNKLHEPLPDKVFVWGFKGGGLDWKAPKNCNNFDVCVRNGCFDLNKKCGKRKDAADFAICMQVGRLDEKLPKHIPFTILSGDKGFHELEVQMENTARRIVVIDPHHESSEMVYRLLYSVIDT